MNGFFGWSAGFHYDDTRGNWFWMNDFQGLNAAGLTDLLEDLERIAKAPKFIREGRQANIVRKARQAELGRRYGPPSRAAQLRARLRGFPGRRLPPIRLITPR